MKKIVDNKSVILVGPASYMEGSLKAKFIESFDVVVRMNNGYFIDESYVSDVGSRTDILYHCLWGPHFPNSIPLLRSRVGILKTSYPNIHPFMQDIEKFNKLNRNRVPVEIYELEKFKFLQNTLRSRPNTGTSAIFDLLSYDISKLHICGVTMFSGGYMEKYRNSFVHKSRREVEIENQKHGVHDIEKQIDFLKKLLNNPIVSMDEEVRRAIYE